MYLWEVERGEKTDLDMHYNSCLLQSWLWSAKFHKNLHKICITLQTNWLVVLVKFPAFFPPQQLILLPTFQINFDCMFQSWLRAMKTWKNEHWEFLKLTMLCPSYPLFCSAGMRWLSDRSEGKLLHHSDGFIRAWVSSSRAGWLVVVTAAGSHAVTYFTGNTLWLALRLDIVGEWSETSESDPSRIPTLLSIIGGNFSFFFIFAQARACSGWASNTQRLSPSWFPEKTSCRPVRLSIKTHWSG